MTGRQPLNLSLTEAEFRARFSDFTEARIGATVVEWLLDVAYDMHSLGNLATLYLTAHLAELWLSDEERSGESERFEMGPFTTDFKAQAEEGRESFFTRTEYGRTFLALRQTTPRFAIGVLAV